MSDQIIFKVNLYVYYDNSNKSSHIKFIQIQIRLIPIHIRLFITITTEAINQLPLEITFHDLGCPFKTFCFVILNFFVFKSVATRIPDLTRLADPRWSPVYSDVFNQSIHFILLNFFIFKSVATRIPDLTRLADPS